MRTGRIARGLAALAVLPCLLISSRPAGARMMMDDGDVFLPRCGIRYPGGYERNTAREVVGRVEGLSLPEAGPVQFLLRGEEESYVVFASPSWYWRDQGIPVRDGDEVRVSGSATVGRDGELYLLAREVYPGSGAWTFHLRDAAGRPAWRGCGPGSCASARVPVVPAPPAGAP